MIAVKPRDRRGISRHFDPGGIIASACFNDCSGRGVKEIMPEFEHFFRSLFLFLRIKCLFVKERAGNTPRLDPETHAVGKPDIIESDRFCEFPVLRTEESSKRETFRNAVRISRIPDMICMKYGIAGDKAVRIDSMRLGDFTMSLYLNSETENSGPLSNVAPMRILFPVSSMPVSRQISIMRFSHEYVRGAASGRYLTGYQLPLIN